VEQPEDVDELLRRYRAVLQEMHDHRIETGGKPRKWNRLFDKSQVLHLLLRASAEGRAGITALALGDDCSTVRTSAASHALFWDEAKVRPVLEAAALDESLGGLDAKMTLREFDAGRLNMTWVPKAR
jgi:hypothetical protein